MASKLVLVALFFTTIFLSFIASHVNALSSNYYAKTCPNAEHAIAEAVKKATKNDKTVPAALLRMHFHDCFIRGCDGSVLLQSTGNNTAEKDGPPNISLHAFYVIDNAKKAIESMCPGIVSCADILAVAARDAVVLSGGPAWHVPKGRLDGRISKASETRLLPAPVFNFTQLKQSFSQRGLSTTDLVSLSGGHTLGFSHCSSFQNRIHKFDSKHDVDPNMNPSFALKLKKACPAHNKVKNAGSTLDSTTGTFDNAYYKLLMQGDSLFSSDQALLSDKKSKKLVSKYAESQEDFNKAFIKSMIKMSSLTGGQEVRSDLGFSHCSSFQTRIHKFNSKHDVDPNMNPSFALKLKKTCPSHNKVKNAGATLDLMTGTFDNAYYKLLMQGDSLFSSDQALLTDKKSKKLVSKYAESQEDFNKAFVKVMIKMSSLAMWENSELETFGLPIIPARTGSILKMMKPS